MQPFVKWVGGKRQLLEEIFKRLPKSYNDYFEPFIGGGALLFALKPDKAHIGDVNKNLINTYNVLKYNVDVLVELLDEYTILHNSAVDKKTFYYGNKRIFPKH